MSASRPAEDRVLTSRPEAPWLPPGGRAEVVLAGAGQDPPDPVCLARLLVTRDGQVLTFPRADGRGLDIPTRAVGEDSLTDCLEALTLGALGGVLRPATLLGFVRNIVPSPTPEYPWPAPQAHFAVWHCSVPPDLAVEGTWLDLGHAEGELGKRHWWPLVDALREGRGP